MQLRDGRLVFSPSDLNDFLECEHLSALEFAVARGELARVTRDDPQAELVRRKGEEHEAAYLERLRAKGREIATPRNAAETRAAIRAGAEVVYQAAFDDGGWVGYADFVEQQPDGLYEVADTKLARTSKPAHLLQLASYSEQVGRIQGRLPERMHVVLGTRERASYHVRDFDAYFRRVRQRFLQWVANPPKTYPLPVAHCAVCDWLARCTRQWEQDDHLSLVAQMRRSWIDKLAGAGITTLEGLARADAELQTELRPEIFDRLRRQAELQHRHRITGEHLFELLPLVEGRGLELLPRPSEGDVFFDIEGDPFYEAARGLEYLFGVVADGTFRAFWAHDRAEERRAFERLVDFLTERLARFPDMHVYHYAHYEPTALKRLMGELGTREDEVDELLRREVFVDLYRVVAESLRISYGRYGLKQVERFFMPAREEDLAAGDDSILVFEQWLESGADELLHAIERYNEFDCRATLALRDWLLDRRREAGVTRWKEPPVPRERTEEQEEAIAERERLRQQLLAGADEGSERWILGQLLEYHRREDRPVWWHYFRRLDATEEQLFDDAEAIAGLEPTGAEPEDVKKSRVHTLSFPAQQHKLGAGEAVDPATERKEDIVEIDDARGLLRLRRGPKFADEPLPRALIPGGPWDTKPQRAALRRLAENPERYPALRAIVRRDPPTSLDPATLGDSYLFIQGPPGSGKTWKGAQIVAALLRDGKRVGVTAPTHKAIHNLLGEIEAVARPVTALKKCSAGDPETKYEGAWVENEDDIEPFRDPASRLLAGTAWLFAREELDQQLDVLVIDEAGQMSLADALAVGTSARSVVLLGDPLQLAQVSQGVHPGGTGCSVLEHLLGDEATVPPDRGLFLERTRRMHPDVCRFVSEVVYDGRLLPLPGLERQRIEGVGAGIRHLPVEHQGNSQASAEEADVIAAEIERLVGREYTPADGPPRPLRHEDVMVVAPYNLQVRCLRGRLPREVPVGTVDKFQGQQAPVVFYSTTSSSGAEIPRGLEFLFSRNRLNVAISRAQCLAYLVGSPRLLDVRCRTVDQMRLVNALCRLVEMAER
ncbi:MAG: TM0106 family RecB-like putative nuclease [Actinomycetota bacterium]|nr:TM0106 family RecB-like putative nuclease [Actinomycetota bacterium]